MEFAPVLPDVLSSGLLKETKSSHLSTSSLFTLFSYWIFSSPLKLLLLQCKGHTHVGPQTTVLLLPSTVQRLFNNPLFLNYHEYPSAAFLVVFFFFPFLILSKKWEGKQVKIDKKKTKCKKKKRLWLTNIYKYVWCGCNWVVPNYIIHNTIKENRIVLMTLLVDTRLFRHRLCVCK